MYDSILHFNEFGVKVLEKIIKTFIEDKTQTIGDLVDMLNKPLQELQCNIISEVFELIDEIYRNDISRKKNWSIIRKDSNSFMTTCGEVKYKRTYFKSKKTGEREYLADKAVGINSHMRISDDVVVKTLENVADYSYRLSGENATNTEDIISKQAVLKQVHDLEIPKAKKVCTEKRKVKVLYIDADEDHVSLQFSNKKGDLEKDKYGRKQNTIMPRLVYVYEGVEKETLNGKRNKLINRHYFGGIYSKPENLWQEVVEYIDENYYDDELEKIYLSGDGASWIKTGIEVIGAKCKFVLDNYHLNKYITQATSHLGDTKDDYKQAIFDEFSFENKKNIKKIFREIIELTTTETKKEAVRRCKEYILSQWNGIIIKNDDPYAQIGCSAEGHVSHIYSSRLSSRPLGWSKIGVDKIARLRIYKANGGKIRSLIKYKKDKVEKEIKKEIQHKIDAKIKMKRLKYLEVWKSDTTVEKIGKTNGLYNVLKSLRGICG
ncbi:ISLre2 family transposase [Abyssisolibacter fermentans]|uniref:ISLre2 family transposase n=1 Tax=Abyssisolibacter fermentans TaxID=1766203 RepID=UPI000836249D|nr:ISLre2 family transposase [Abyssisolibacter fermentans]